MRPCSLSTATYCICQAMVVRTSMPNPATVKLDRKKAEKMRKLHATGDFSIGELALAFRVSRMHVRRIIRGEVWR